jgi:hypothetical protein
MHTTILTKDGKRHMFISQQYFTDLYVAIYDKTDGKQSVPLHQMSVRTKNEAAYHRKLRKTNKFDPDNSSILPTKKGDK